MLLSKRLPWLYGIAVWRRRVERYADWILGDARPTRERQDAPLSYRVKKHQSLLCRKLGTSDPMLQVNKVINLRLVASRLDGVLIRPGETFSFYRHVGLPTRRRGFALGMELSNGEARPGIGGGICQAASLIHWLVLHSPLTVVEHHHHSFDPFPDEGRILPFGSGATVFYNYADYCFRNDTEDLFQLRLRVLEHVLEGDLRCERELPFSYHVFEKNHGFSRVGDKYFRHNELWRDVMDKAHGGAIVATQQLRRNFCEVRYTPPQFAADAAGRDNTAELSVVL
jgi:vancomycin resistance protein VanW